MKPGIDCGYNVVWNLREIHLSALPIGEKSGIDIWTFQHLFIDPGSFKHFWHLFVLLSQPTKAIISADLL